jgi:SEC-C motif domain protein
VKPGACPCESGVLLALCCGRFIFDGALPENAEQLMRSRYSAYVLREPDYLLRTWHASTRPAALTLAEDSRWLGLTIKRHVMQEPDRALVEFVARYRVGGKGHRLHETSRFERLNGQWLYVDGTFAGEKHFASG